MHRSITSEIFQVGGGEFTAAEDAAIYLIHYEGTSALVDAGCGRHLDLLFDNIRECGASLETIECLLITHCHYDHIGGAAAIRERLRCSTAAHELEAPYLEQGDNRVTAAEWYGSKVTAFPVDYKLSGKTSGVELGGRLITAHHIPGHSPGSVAYLTESDGKKVLFGQDVHGPLDPVLKSNRQDYVDSLYYLISLDADILCEGHFGLFYGKNTVHEFIRSFL